MFHSAYLALVYMTCKNLNSLPQKTSRVGFLTVFALIALVILVSHCDSNSGIDPNPEKELVCTTEPVEGVLQPLSEGSYWKFNFFDGTRLADSIRFDVLKEVSLFVGGKTITAFETTDINASDTAFVYRSYLSNGLGGLFTNGRIAEGDTLVINKLMYPFPTFVGEEFKRPILDVKDGTVVADRSSSMTVISVDEEVETPAGTFTAIVYRKYAPPPSDVALGSFLDFYYAPGIGFVAYRQLDESTLGTKYEQLLTEYCIAILSS